MACMQESSIKALRDSGVKTLQSSSFKKNVLVKSRLAMTSEVFSHNYSRGMVEVQTFF